MFCLLRGVILITLREFVDKQPSFSQLKVLVKEKYEN